MLLVLDIGNTAVTYGLYNRDRSSKMDLPVSIKSGSLLYNDIPKFVKNCSKSGLNINNKVVISSVVPKIIHKLKMLFKPLGWQVSIAGQDLKVPIRHRYPKGQYPGIDRLVNLYGAAALYRKPLLVIDYGTAITFDYLSSKGVFEGGMIVPGPELSFQALIKKAALLPKKMSLPHKAPSFIGKSTLSCLTSGVLQGYGAMTDELIRRFKSKLSRNLKVVATGGFSRHLHPYCKEINVVDPLLSVKSLFLLAKIQLPS